MTYSFDLLLKQESSIRWRLLTPTGKVFYEFIAHSLVDAQQVAKVYMSSWGSVRIMTEDEKQERDSLSNKT